MPGYEKNIIIEKRSEAIEGWYNSYIYIFNSTLNDNICDFTVFFVCILSMSLIILTLTAAPTCHIMRHLISLHPSKKGMSRILWKITKGNCHEMSIKFCSILVLVLRVRYQMIFDHWHTLLRTYTWLLRTGDLLYLWIKMPLDFFNKKKTPLNSNSAMGC